MSFNKRKQAVLVIIIMLLAVVLLSVLLVLSNNGIKGEKTMKQTFTGEPGDARLLAAMQRGEKGEPLNIGFIGGSITYGEADIMSRYSNVVTKWFVEKFPQSEINQINCGISATTSLLGLFRVEGQLLSQKPDVAFVEWSVNDWGIPAQCYETVIRKTLQSEKQPAVIPIYMVRKDGASTQDVHSSVAKYYKLHDISFKDSFYPKVQDGSYKWSDYYADEYHPNKEGHAMVAGLITDYLESTYQLLEVTGDIVITELPQAQNGYMFPNARMLGSDSISPKLSDGWEKGDFSQITPGWKSTKAGAEIVFEVEASTIGVCVEKWRSDKRCTAAVTVDNREPVYVSGTQGTGQLTEPTVVALNIGKGKHTVKIKVLGPDEGSDETQLRLCALLLSD